MGSEISFGTIANVFSCSIFRGSLATDLPNSVVGVGPDCARGGSTGAGWKPPFRTLSYTFHTVREDVRESCVFNLLNLPHFPDLPNFQNQGSAMAHKKGVGSSRNGRDSNPQYLGVKRFGGEFVRSGNILVRQRKPEKLVEDAVHGMLPKTKMGAAMYRKLKVYAGPDHPHAAQKPSKLEVA